LKRNYIWGYANKKRLNINGTLVDFPPTQAGLSVRFYGLIHEVSASNPHRDNLPYGKVVKALCYKSEGR
jgi:hypothetical protein